MTRTGQRQPLIVLVMVTLTIAGCASGAGDTGAGSDAGNPPATNHAKAVKFAECMRSNGVSAFPDPKSSGELTIDAIANGSSVNTDSPAFKQALGACKRLEPSGFTGKERSAQQQEAGLRFAQCIRRNGVRDFPDPVPNGPLVDTNRIPSSATDSGMAILNAAMQRCRGMAAAAGVTR